jgi:hypothetical protein
VSERPAGWRPAATQRSRRAGRPEMALGPFSTAHISRREVCKNCVNCGSLYWAPIEQFCSLECDLSHALRHSPRHVDHLVVTCWSRLRTPESPLQVITATPSATPPAAIQLAAPAYRPFVTCRLQR